MNNTMHKTLFLLSALMSFSLVHAEIDRCTINGLQGEYPKEVCRFLKDPHDSLRSSVGVLLHGPAGNGKSTLVESIAKENNGLLRTITSGDIISKYHGESVTNLRAITESLHAQAVAEKKRAYLFIEESDTIASKNDSESSAPQLAVVTELNVLMDHYKNDPHIVIIYSTNNFNKLYQPFINRFGKAAIEIKNPTADMRKLIAMACNDTYKTKLLPDQIDHIVKNSEGLSCRSLKLFFRDLNDGGQQQKPVTLRTINEDLKKIRDDNNKPNDSDKDKTLRDLNIENALLQKSQLRLQQTLTNGSIGAGVGALAATGLIAVTGTATTASTAVAGTTATVTAATGSTTTIGAGLAKAAFLISTPAGQIALAATVGGAVGIAVGNKIRKWAYEL